MSKYTTAYNAKDLTQRLVKEGLVEKSEELSSFIIKQQQDEELPLYLRALVGVGAFIASICFIIFLLFAGIINSGEELELIIWGLAFVAGAIGLQHKLGNGNTVKHSFFMQSSFASMAVGKGLFVFGMAEYFASQWGASIAILIITGITYHTYKMSIDRFLSSFTFLFSVLINILWDWELNFSRELLFNGFLIIQVLGAAMLLTHGKIKRDYMPLSYAFIFSLCASVIFLASHAEFRPAELGTWGGKVLLSSVFTNVILTACLISLFAWAAGSIHKLKSEPLILASLGALLLGFVSAPGIILAIGLIVLGYAKHDKLLAISGGLLIPIFIFLYYYNLDISLMQKSGVLAGSGFVLLLGRFYLQKKGWDKGGVLCAQK